MSLKDASAYNIQFRDGRPVLIDTLSFDAYREGEPWVAYRQFCQHFLAPLALMAHTDVRLSQLLRVYIDGIPLTLAANCCRGDALPARPDAAPPCACQAAGKNGASAVTKARAGRWAGRRSLGLIESLQADGPGPAVEGFRNGMGRVLRGKQLHRDLVPGKDRNSSANSSGAMRRERSGTWAATPACSAASPPKKATRLVCFDSDYGAVERNYLAARRREGNAPAAAGARPDQPLAGDRMGTTANAKASLARGPADTVLALALVHHLAIGNNVPLGRIAEFLARCGSRLIIEFVPKEDSQVRRLLATRKDIFTEYTREGFEAAFLKVYRIGQSVPIPESARILYLMERK